MTCRTTSPIASAPWTNARPFQPRPPTRGSRRHGRLFGSDGPTFPIPTPASTERYQLAYGSRNRNVSSNHAIHRYGTVPRGHQPVPVRNRHDMDRAGRKAGVKPGNVHPPQKRVGRHPRSIRASSAHHADSTPSTTCRNSKRHRNTKQQRSIQWKKRKDSASTARNSP